MDRGGITHLVRFTPEKARAFKRAMQKAQAEEQFAFDGAGLACQLREIRLRVSNHERLVAMTRDEIERSYQHAAGRIVSPGKFEGEPIWTPYFYEEWLSGFADQEDGDTAVFHLTAEDRATWPELSGEWVSIEQSDIGFVRGRTHAANPL